MESYSREINIQKYSALVYSERWASLPAKWKYIRSFSSEHEQSYGFIWSEQAYIYFITHINFFLRKLLSSFNLKQ